jgi:membrane peptidoglycan carboxypeptidase
MQRWARIAGIAGLGLLAALLGLVGFEAWRVIDARAKTPALLRGALAGADPQLAALSPHQIDALVLIEDPTFWTNDGLDFTSPGQGHTTLTQGLAKRFYFRRFKPGFARLGKLELMLLTKFALNARATKQEILSATLATAYFGNDKSGPIVGFAEGARRWYGRELSELDFDSYLGLVAMLIAPNALNPLAHGEANAERVERIKRRLAGECVPNGHRDVVLDGCARVSV